MDLTKINPDVTLDVRSLSCPMPTLKTAKAMKGMKPGQIIEVLGTDPGTKKDLPRRISQSSRGKRETSGWESLMTMRVSIDST